VVEKFQKSNAAALGACAKDDAELLAEFRRGQEWGQYRTSMVERTIEVYKGMKALRR
jgi:hypothetical protein